MQATNSQRILLKKSCQNLHITSFDGFPFHFMTYIFSAALHDIWSGTGPKFPGLHDCQCDQCHRFQSGTHLVSGMLVWPNFYPTLLHILPGLPFFRPKTNNQTTKKVLSFMVTWVKVVRMCKILTFKVNFLFQKGSESF